MSLLTCLRTSSFRRKSLIHFQPSFAQSVKQESNLIHLQMYFQCFQQYLLSRLSLCHSVLCLLCKKLGSHYFVSLLPVPRCCSISLSSCSNSPVSAFQRLKLQMYDISPCFLSVKLLKLFFISD